MIAQAKLREITVPLLFVQAVSLYTLALLILRHHCIVAYHGFCFMTLVFQITYALTTIQLLLFFPQVSSYDYYILEFGIFIYKIFFSGINPIWSVLFPSFLQGCCPHNFRRITSNRSKLCRIIYRGSVWYQSPTGQIKGVEFNFMNIETGPVHFGVAQVKIQQQTWKAGTRTQKAGWEFNIVCMIHNHSIGDIERHSLKSMREGFHNLNGRNWAKIDWETTISSQISCNNNNKEQQLTLIMCIKYIMTP